MACACSFNKERIVYGNQGDIRKSPIKIKRKVCSPCIRIKYCKDTHDYPPENLAKQQSMHGICQPKFLWQISPGICIPCFEVCAQKGAQPRSAEQERTGVVKAATSAHSIPTVLRYE